MVFWPFWRYIMVNIVSNSYHNRHDFTSLSNITRTLSHLDLVEFCLESNPTKPADSISKLISQHISASCWGCWRFNRQPTSYLPKFKTTSHQFSYPYLGQKLESIVPLSCLHRYGGWKHVRTLQRGGFYMCRVMSCLCCLISKGEAVPE